eukprot:1147753-Pelagomonas_calceolata.AAC.12
MSEAGAARQGSSKKARRHHRRVGSRRCKAVQLSRRQGATEYGKNAGTVRRCDECYISLACGSPEAKAQLEQNSIDVGQQHNDKQLQG